MEKFLFQPVNPFIITQNFGDNRVCKYPDGRLVMKTNEASCPVGSRSLYPPGGHTGIDLLARRWQPVYASQDGFVEEIQTEEARGLGIGVITHKKYYTLETNSYEHQKYRNWHFIALNVHKEDKVKTVRTGDLLGYADSTGYSTADHNHFELKPVAQNPDGTWYNILQNNGTYGAINPLTYMRDMFALDYKNKLQRILEQLAIILDRLSDYFRRQQI
jgi:murein DD-endopeptidase MepM/ murein hydrolase activator NlpD